MSNIGLQEEIAEADEFRLVQTVGSGFGEIYDCDGDHVLNVPPEEMNSVAAAFDTFVAMFRAGFKEGHRNGSFVAKAEIRKALGL